MIWCGLCELGIATVVELGSAHLLLSARAETAVNGSLTNEKDDLPAIRYRTVIVMSCRHQSRQDITIIALDCRPCFGVAALYECSGYCNLDKPESSGRGRMLSDRICLRGKRNGASSQY